MESAVLWNNVHLIKNYHDSKPPLSNIHIKCAFIFVPLSTERTLVAIEAIGSLMNYMKIGLRSSSNSVNWIHICRIITLGIAIHIMMYVVFTTNLLFKLNFIFLFRIYVYFVTYIFYKLVDLQCTLSYIFLKNVVKFYFTMTLPFPSLLLFRKER